jgi:hypothetical protein
MFASEIKNDDYLGYSFFLALISKTPLLHHPILVRAIALRQDPVRTNTVTSNHKEMKINSTLLRAVLSAVIVFTLNLTLVNAQCTTPALTYTNPVLVSGTAGLVNARYKFPSVAPGVDAYITILNRVGGATLTNIDDNVNGYSAAWQPTVRTKSNPGAGESYISFKIEYKDAGTQNPHVFNCFALSFIDVDGDNDKVREFVAAKGFYNFTVANNTALTISQQSGMTKALGPVTNFYMIDTSSYQTNINFMFMNTDKVDEVWIGSKVSYGFVVQDRLSCAYFSNIYIPNGGPLPVKYLSFDAVVNDNTVMLNWITAEEMNHNYFEVERSFDMDQYSTLGMVLDGFTINGNGKRYQFKDNSPELSGRQIAYYRLKQFDIDGKFTYSKVIAVRLQAKTDVVMQVSPNPFSKDLNVRFTSAESGTAQIRIVNSTGQTMLSKQALISKGYNNIQVEGLSGLATGMYVAQLIMNGMVIDNQRVIKNTF